MEEIDHLIGAGSFVDEDGFVVEYPEFPKCENCNDDCELCLPDEIRD